MPRSSFRNCGSTTTRCAWIFLFLCSSHFSLPVFKSRVQKQKTKTMTIGEYHTTAHGQSKKLQLMNIINDCMRHASNRDEFIVLMKSEGFKVRWEKSRKNIIYTTPSGWKCCF